MKDVIERIEKLEKRTDVIEKSLRLVKNANITCDNPKCLHEWFTRTKMQTVSCPSCGKKVKVRK